MVSLAMRGTDALSEHAAHQLIATAVDLIVHIDLIDEPAQLGHGARRRVVSQVLEVTGVGEGGRAATNEVFAPGQDGRAETATTPACLTDLVDAGFQPHLLEGTNGDGSR
jgi:Flp pilus assembly CpaF family ATPase